MPRTFRPEVVRLPEEASSYTRQRALFISFVSFQWTFNLSPKIDEAGGATGEPTRGRRSEELLRWRGLESRSAGPPADAATSEATMAARRRPRRARPLGASPPAGK